MITSTSNLRVKWVRSLQLRRRARRQEGLFVVEGLRLVQEAVAAGVRARLVLYAEPTDAPLQAVLQPFRDQGVDVLRVSPEVMGACSNLESPPGLLAVLPFPEPALPPRIDLALVLEGLADPGNLGTVLRTALAAGVQLAVLCEGTVDAYNPKVVRGAMGAHFHLPLRGASVKQLPAILNGLPIWLADARAGRAYSEINWPARLALAVGGEASGASDDLRTRAHGLVHVPMQPPVESLNAAAAAAVILFEIRRQRGLA